MLQSFTVFSINHGIYRKYAREFHAIFNKSRSHKGVMRGGAGPDSRVFMTKGCLAYEGRKRETLCNVREITCNNG